MRILWHSNAAWVGSGYGSQTRLFTPRIRDLGNKIAMSAYWGLNGAVMSFDGMTVYPGDEQWGNRLLAPLAELFEADLVITLMDVWVLNAKKFSELPLACWVPVDHEPCPEKVSGFFERTGARPIAMSRFGERMLTDAGQSPLYVPHGVDTRVYRPREENRERTRARMGISPDAFVVGMVAANKGSGPPRKAFPQVLQAFAKLREERSDAYLYLHTDPVNPQGMAIGKVADMLGIDDEAIRYTTPLQLELGVPDDDVADLYSAFDVLANPSYGEGFGIPILEAQSCGTRVIVTDCTAMSELCGPGSWLVDGDPWFDGGTQNSFYKCPTVTGILDAFREAYERRGEGPDLEARRFALDYDADIVTKRYWKPALAELAGAVQPVRIPARTPVPA